MAIDGMPALEQIILGDRSPRIKVHTIELFDFMELPQRRKNESDSQYLGFITYCQLGPGRSIRGAYQVHCERQGRKPSKANHFARWAAEFDWIARAGEYDISLREEIHRSVLSEIREKTVNQHQKYEKIIDAHQSIGVRLLKILNELSSEDPAKIPGGRESIEGFRSLTASYTNLVNSFDKSHGLWGHIIGLEQLSEKLTQYEQEQAGNVIPISTRPEPRSLSPEERAVIYRGQIDHRK